MKPPESLFAHIHRNLCENTNWLYDLVYDEEDKRGKLQRYYIWHFKELVLCILLAVLLTRVDKVQQFFSAFSTDIKTYVQLPLQFVAVFGLNGVVIFWLCYVFWHKPARLNLGRWRQWICGDRRREDFEAYYRKPGNSWRVAMVSSLPMLLVSGTLSLALLRDNPLDNKVPTALSSWLESNALVVLFGTAVLYLIIGSLIRPASNVCDSRSKKKHQIEPEDNPPAHSGHKKQLRRLEKIFHCERCSEMNGRDGQHLEDCPKTAEEYDALLDRLWKIFRLNFRRLLATMAFLGIVLWFYHLYAAPFNYLALLVFSLWGPLAVAFFLNSFSECLIVEAQKKDAYDKEGKVFQPKFEIFYDRLMWTSYLVSIVIFLMCNSKSITSQEWFSQWMFPIAMLMFVFIAYYQLLDLLVYNMTVLRFYALIGVLLVLLLFFPQQGHYRMKFNGEVPRSGSLQRASLEVFFLQWAKERFLTEAPGHAGEVYLVAAEGGGSRSGAWTSAVLTQLDSISDGQFRHRCFAMSAVSGGSFGVAATLALWDNSQQAGITDASVYNNGCRPAYLNRIFKRNYISTGLAGIFFFDFLQQIPGVHLLFQGQYSRTDRHQDEEDNAVCIGLGEIFGQKKPLQHNYLKKTNFLSLYYLNEWGETIARPKTDLPLFFPNTCRVEDGRRGIVSPVLVDDSPTPASSESSFNAAVVDIVGIAREKNPANSLSLGEATSLSELFPFVNSTVFINENTGSFMDGGAYENLGLTTLYEIRTSLGKICVDPDSAWIHQMLPDSSRAAFTDYLNKLRFKMLLIYNFDNHGNESRIFYEGSSLKLLDPITAMMQTPFGGHTDYMYHKVKSELGAQEVVDFPLLTSREPRSSRSDKIVMSRWLSKYEMSEIMKRAVVCVDTNLCRLNSRWCEKAARK